MENEKVFDDLPPEEHTETLDETEHIKFPGDVSAVISDDSEDSEFLEKAAYDLRKKITKQILLGNARSMKEFEVIFRDFPVHRNIKAMARKSVKKFISFMREHKLKFDKNLIISNTMTSCFLSGERHEGRYCKIMEYRNRDVDPPNIDIWEYKDNGLNITFFKEVKKAQEV